MISISHDVSGQELTTMTYDARQSLILIFNAESQLSVPFILDNNVKTSHYALLQCEKNVSSLE